MIQATPQAVGTFEHTDAPYHSRVPMPALHKPVCPFVSQTRFGTMPGLRQDDALHASGHSDLFIGPRIDPAIRTGWAWRVPKGIFMRLQAGFPLLTVRGIAFQDAIVTDDPPVHFIRLYRK